MESYVTVVPGWYCQEGRIKWNGNCRKRIDAWWRHCDGSETLVRHRFRTRDFYHGVYNRGQAQGTIQLLWGLKRIQFWGPSLRKGIKI